MLDFGTSNDNSNYYDFGDLAALEFTDDFSVGFFGYVDTLAGTWQTWFSKVDATNGWVFRSGSGHSNKPALVIGDGGGFDVYLATTVLNADTTVRNYVAAFDESAHQTDFYVDGSADGSPTNSRNVTAAASATVEINDSAAAGSLGSSGARGHVCAWSKYLSSAEAAEFSAGQTMPAPGNLVFWMRGLVDPPLEQQNLATGSKTGTVTVESHAVDGYFQDSDYMTWVLAEIFMPFLLAAGAGANLMGDVTNMLRSMSRRCTLDWTHSELKTLTEAFRTRPSFVY